MSAKTYFLTTLFIFSVFLTLESVTNASEEDNEIEIDVSESLTETITETPAATIIVVKNVPKRHKLNAKQVLMLNQIVGGFTLDGVKDPLCKNHTMLYKQGLREFKPWAMKSLFRRVFTYIICTIYFILSNRHISNNYKYLKHVF